MYLRLKIGNEGRENKDIKHFRTLFHCRVVVCDKVMKELFLHLQCTVHEPTYRLKNQSDDNLGHSCSCITGLQ